ncbi:MAG: signal peptidase II [Selenomonadaceae bacterium]|nr:signal peptidase II [Selenomonadaceae bacterium]
MAGILFFGIIVLDQIVKLAVKANMAPGETIPLIPHVFHFTYVLNPGAAFGILENQRLFFIVAGVLILLFFGCLYPRMRKQDPWLRYGCAALLGGAVGNLIDRIYNGLVVDFFDFRIWPVFNIADIAIVGGVGCMMYSILFRFKEAKAR